MPTAAEERRRNITVIILRDGSFIVSHQNPFLRLSGDICLCHLQI